MSGLGPGDQGMMVRLSYCMLVSPLTIFSLKKIERFIIFLERIMIVAKFESIIIVGAYLFNAKKFRLGKSNNVRLITLLTKKIMLCSFECMLLEIKHCHTWE